MTGILSILFQKIAVCGSHKCPKPEPLIVYSNPKKTPTLTEIKENKLFQARMRAKSKREDEMFIDRISKNPDLIQEYEKEEGVSVFQLQRTLGRDSCLSISQSTAQSMIVP